MHLDEFVGKHINAAYIDNTKTVMHWIVNGEWYKLDAVGDCCSYSWYQHCDSGDVLQNATLNEFEYVHLERKNGEDGYSVIQIDMLKFKTDRGYCTIEFRNSSNGYYSGWCEVHKEGPEDKDKLNVLGDF